MSKHLWKVLHACTQRKEWHLTFKQVCVKDQRVKIFVNESWSAEMLLTDINHVCLFAQAKRVCSRDNSRQKRGVTLGSSLPSSDFNSVLRRYHRVLIDTGEGKWSIQDKAKRTFSLGKSTYSRTLQKKKKTNYRTPIIMITSHNRYCRWNLLKTVSQFFF